MPNKPIKRKFQKNKCTTEAAVDELVKRNPMKPAHILPCQSLQINPFLDDKQLAIVIFAFNNKLSNHDEFDEENFKQILARFFEAENFFRKKTSRAKRAKSTNHLTSILIPRVLSKFGARYGAIIRPVAHPNVNLHPIQSLVNSEWFSETSTLWCFEKDIKTAADNPAKLKLALKVMDYECDKTRTRGAESLPMYKTVEEYAESMVGWWSF